MNVYKFDYNSLDDLISNTYIISDDSLKCVVIDPGKEGSSISEFIEKHQLTPVAILLTHGHIDHIRGVDFLAEKYHLNVYVHYLDEEMLKDEELNLSYELGESRTISSNIITINDNECLKLLDKDIVVIHTPFHTKGSVCYYIKEQKALFTGDTLFKESIGRDDLPNADPRKTKESLSKLKKLPKDTTIYPGHGNNTILESELLNNHFLIY